MLIITAAAGATVDKSSSSSTYCFSEYRSYAFAASRATYYFKAEASSWWSF